MFGWVMRMPTKPLRCRLHLHHWETLTTPDGESYDCCARCKADRAIYTRDPKANIVGMDYAAFRGVAHMLGRRQRK
jgi:hypothetical protein